MGAGEPGTWDAQQSLLLRRLGVAEEEKDVVEDFYNGLLASALAHCNRTTTPPALLKIVQDAVCAAWRQRGDEGSTASIVGGQSYTYEDIEVAMHKRLVAAGLRVVRI